MAETKPQFQKDLLPTSVVAADEASASEETRVPFFSSRRRGRSKKQDPWLISLFVILHLVAFFATMSVNDCYLISHRQCALQSLGRFSFQPLSENPLLGPSASTLDKMGALSQKFLKDHHHTWRLFTSPMLHAGVIHLLINLSSVVFVGIYLEQEFRPTRIGMVYLLSAFSGSFFAALFLQNRPSVSSSGALFGLLGTMLSGLIRNWKLYSDKMSTLLVLLCIFSINFILGFLPYVNNFSNIGGFISGFLLGFVLLFSPQPWKVLHSKVGLYEYNLKKSIKEKLDQPVLRTACLVVFCALFAGVLIAVMHGINFSKMCRWCQYIDCVPLKKWSCIEENFSCKTMVGEDRLTLTCTNNNNFKVFSFTNISRPRLDDLCSLICA